MCANNSLSPSRHKKRKQFFPLSLCFGKELSQYDQTWHPAELGQVKSHAALDTSITISVTDQIGRFMKVLGDFFCKKQLNYTLTFGSILKNLTFQVKTTGVIFWATFGKFRLHFFQHLVTLMSMAQIDPENTHLLHKGKYHCTDHLLFAGISFVSAALLICKLQCRDVAQLAKRAL